MTDLTVNGKDYRLDIAPDRTLADVLRDELGLIGVRVSCSEGECGSCTILVDDKPVTSCLVLANQAQGKKIETIEGIGKSGALHPIQEAFSEEQGFQCGACTPGFVMATKAFLNENPNPTEEQATVAMSGNICRCGAHPYIVQSVMNAAARMNDSGDKSK